MRVLHVNSGNLFGGVETLLVTLAQQRDQCAGMEPAFAVCFAGRLDDELRAAGVPVRRLGDVQVRRPWTVWSARRRLAEWLREERFDAVICHAAWVQAIFGPVVRKARQDLVFWLHDPPGESLHWLERWARMTPPDVAICNSRYTLERLPRLYPNVLAEVVYCAVPKPVDVLDDAERAALRTAHGADAGTTVIVQAGRIARHKGHLLQLEALGRMKDVPGWICWQIGGAQTPAEEQYMIEMRAAANRLGIADRVRFLGWQPDARKLLAAADVFCQPNSLPEPFGIVFVEALYAGLPVVATATGGAVEVVETTCGVLIQQGDVEGLSRALERLVRNAQWRRQLSRGGPARADFLCNPAARLADLERVLRGDIRS